MSEDTRVAAVGDDNPRFQRFLKAARFDLRAAGSGSLSFFQPRYLLIASAAASVGQRAYPLFRHQAENLDVAIIAVLDGLDPATRTGAFPSFEVAWATTGHPADRAVSTMSFSSSTENGPGPFLWSPREVGVNLDPVCAPADLVADDAPQGAAVGLFRAPGEPELRGRIHG